MYNFVFFFFFNYFKKINDPIPVLRSTTITAFAAFSHIFFIGAAVRYFTGYLLPRFAESEATDKLYVIPLALLFLLLFYLYYRMQGVEIKYLKNMQM